MYSFTPIIIARTSPRTINLGISIGLVAWNDYGSHFYGIAIYFLFWNIAIAIEKLPPVINITNVVKELVDEAKKRWNRVD